MHDKPASQSAPAAARFEAWSKLVQQADALRSEGRDTAAIHLARQAENQLGTLEPPDTPAAVRALNQAGVIFFEYGYSRSALPLYERALELALRCERREEECIATLQNNLGQVRFHLGEAGPAQAHLAAAVEIRRRISPGSIVLASACDNFGSVLAARSDLHAAEALHLEALEIFERRAGPFDGHVATALGNLARVLAARNEPRRALACQLRALDIWQRSDRPLSSGWVLGLANLANRYLDNGDLLHADRMVNHLLALGQMLPDAAHRNLGEMLLGLARTALGDFRLDLAVRFGARALEILETVAGPAAPETLRAIKVLANVHRARGDDETAEPLLRRVLDGFTSLQMETETTEVMVDLSRVYRGMGSHALAGQILDAALARARVHPERNARLIASTLGNRALTHYEAGNYRSADQDFAAALAAHPDSGDGADERPWLIYQRGMLAYHLGDYPRARDHYTEAQRLWQEAEGDDHPHVGTTLANLALVHWAEGNADQALACFVAAEKARGPHARRTLLLGNESARAVHAREIHWELCKFVTFCLGFGASSPAAAAFGAQLLLRYKGRVLDAIAQTSLVARGGGDPQDRYAIARLDSVRAELGQLMGPVLMTRRPSAQPARIAALRAEEARLEERLSHRGALRRVELADVALSDVENALPPDSAVLEFFRFREFDPQRTGSHRVDKGERYAAMIIRPGFPVRWFNLGPVEDVDPHVEAWRRLLRNRHAPATEGHEAATVLYTRLIQPLAEALAEVRRLLVVPDNSLALIPLGLLRPATGAPLGSGRVVSYLTSARDLVTSPSVPLEGARSVVLAAPDFDGDPGPAESVVNDSFRDRGRLVPLPGSRDEADSVGRLIGNTQVLTGSAATAAALRQVSRPFVLHVATHGIFAALEDETAGWKFDFLSTGNDLLTITRRVKEKLVNPMYFSGLAFAGANRGGTQGIVTAQEIAGLDLHGTELVVLSACETGLGTSRLGGEFIGLRRALAIAGARTQVTSLWRVDDTATRVLMTHFYGMLKEGVGRAEALQRAQTCVATDSVHPEWKHPVYWAGFVCAGAWEPMPASFQAAPPAETGRTP